MALDRGGRDPFQGGGLRVDAGGGAAATGVDGPTGAPAGVAGRALRDLIRRLLEGTPAVCLFVRAENGPAIALYESVGMQHVLDYRSVLL